MTGKLRITVRDSKSESYSPRNINTGKATQFLLKKPS